VSIEPLLEGYRRFRATRFPAAQTLYRQLGALGQSPRIMFIACCDSRVDPATIFDTSPGEVFVIRNVANLVPPDSPMAKVQAMSAALEFAVLHLQVGHIVVMGHAQCGGAKILLEGQHERIPNAEYIGSWMSLAALARERLMRLPCPPAERLQQIEYQIVRLGMENLLTYPWIRERVEDGRLEIHGCHFGITNGVLALFDEATGEFTPVPPEKPDGANLK
jgi:carbonic anhydrase